MTLLINKETLQSELSDSFSKYSSSIYILHTDIGALGLIENIRSKASLLDAYFEIIMNASKDSTLLFPTFNYDYCKTRVYDIQKDCCQVGVLNEYVRKKYPHARTETPVFNFVCVGEQRFDSDSQMNPFGKDSIWAEVERQDGWVCFWGAGFHANTFIHYIEELCAIWYRYHKKFPGVILDGETRNKVDFLYRVRPLIDGAVDYDWDRLEKDLERQGLLFKEKSGLGSVLFYRIKSVRQYWEERIRDDELFLVTPESRASIMTLYEKFGRPLQYETMEQNNDGVQG